MRTIETPISKETVASFKVGEQIMLKGRIIKTISSKVFISSKFFISRFQHSIFLRLESK